jgi:hypothetical protein
MLPAATPEFVAPGLRDAGVALSADVVRACRSFAAPDANLEPCPAVLARKTSKPRRACRSRRPSDIADQVQEMTLTTHDHVIEQLSTKGAYPPFREAVGAHCQMHPKRAERRNVSG